MAKVINFTYKDKDYTLEYTRKTLEKMEADGINLTELDKKPVTILPKLFEYAFFANHKRMSKELIGEMFGLLTDKNEMYNKLSEMAMETLNTYLRTVQKKRNQVDGEHFRRTVLKNIYRNVLRSFPFYLSIGMTYEQFWENDPSLAKYYREADKLRNERKNTDAWIQGMYIYDAVSTVVYNVWCRDKGNHQQNIQRNRISSMQ